MSSVNPYQTPSDVAPTPPGSPQPLNQPYAPYQSAVGLGTAVKVLLGIVACGKVTAIAATTFFLFTIPPDGDITSASAFQFAAVLVMVTVLGSLAIEIVTAITYLVWVHRVYKNLPALGATSLEASPGWAVGHYFIPILNLFRPYQTMKEIWRNSLSRTGLRRPSALIGWWWAGWIVCLILGRISDTMANDDSMEPGFLMINAGVDLALHSVAIATSVAAAMIVHCVSRNQEQLHREMSLQGGVVPPTLKPATTSNFAFLSDK